MNHHLIRHVTTYALDSALLGVLLNGVLALLAYLVWRVYRNQLTVMEDTLKESRRYNKAAEEANEVLRQEARTNNLNALEQTRISNAATDESIKLAKDTLELGKRAWIVADFEPVYTYGRTGPIFEHYKISATNVGGIPATDVEAWCSFDSWDSLKPTDEVPEDITPKHSQLLGKGSVVGAGRPLDWSPAADWYHANAGNTGTLVTCYCKITYLDFFKQPRETVACWQYKGGNISSKEWVASSKHNTLL
jgi:hypothetical protein